MSPQRELFSAFLVDLGLSDPAGLLSRFELYHLCCWSLTRG